MMQVKVVATMADNKWVLILSFNSQPGNNQRLVIYVVMIPEMVLAEARANLIRVVRWLNE